MVKFDVTSKTSAEMAASSLAHTLGFTSPKRSVHIRIRFSPGVSHTSWTSPKSSIKDCATLAAVLVSGYKTVSHKGHSTGSTVTTVPARPIFENYMALYEDEAMELCIKAFKTYSHWSVKQRAEKAGKAIIEDMKRKTRQGMLNLAANQGKYAIKKAGLYGTAPFVATQDLLRSLEVVVE